MNNDEYKKDLRSIESLKNYVQQNTRVIPDGSPIRRAANRWTEALREIDRLESVISDKEKTSQAVKTSLGAYREDSRLLGEHLINAKETIKLLNGDKTDLEIEVSRLEESIHQLNALIEDLKNKNLALEHQIQDYNVRLNDQIGDPVFRYEVWLDEKRLDGIVYTSKLETLPTQESAREYVKNSKQKGVFKIKEIREYSDGSSFESLVHLSKKEEKPVNEVEELFYEVYASQGQGPVLAFRTTDFQSALDYIKANDGSAMFCFEGMSR